MQKTDLLQNGLKLSLFVEESSTVIDMKNARCFYLEKVVAPLALCDVYFFAAMAELVEKPCWWPSHPSGDSTIDCLVLTPLPKSCASSQSCALESHKSYLLHLDGARHGTATSRLENASRLTSCYFWPFEASAKAE